MSESTVGDEDEEYVPFPIPGGLAVPRLRLPPGQWVPWCVTHGSTGAVPEATWCSSATYSLGDCVWHRAFIPEVEGDMGCCRECQELTHDAHCRLAGTDNRGVEGDTT